MAEKPKTSAGPKGAAPAREPRAYELLEEFNSAELAVGERLVRIEQGERYETDDPNEIAALDVYRAVKAVGS
jgi:hypothetical protein